MVIGSCFLCIDRNVCVVTFFLWFAAGVPSGEWELFRVCCHFAGDNFACRLIATVGYPFLTVTDTIGLRTLLATVFIMALCAMARIWGFLDRFFCAFRESGGKRERSVS